MTHNLTQSAPRSDEILSRRSGLSNSPYTYQSLSVIRKLNKARSPVYLTVSKIDRQYYAMKTFFHEDGDSHEYFQNEIRFAPLQHPNIMKIVHHERERDMVQKGELKKASYILMEYAPYGDLFTFITQNKSEIDDKLARTYFRQLIEGVEYLHQKGVVHLDLKPENLLLDSNFNLKIIDFDLSYMVGDAKILSNGTKYYRAPEFFKDNTPIHWRNQRASSPADIYSAGIILFILKSGGMYPHAENYILDGVNFVDLMYKSNNKFWATHCKFQEKKSSFFESSFKDLFNHMVKLNPNERWSIQQIKKSKWYNGPVYSPQELQNKMKILFKREAETRR